MSKEQTPLEEYKHSLVECLKAHQDENPNKEVCTVLTTIILEFNELLTKEKEQREELIKKTYADALIDLTMFEEGKISKEEMEMIYKRAEQYYNEVIKGRN
jgi:hypothetical protein